MFAVFGVIYRKAAPGWAGLAIGMVVFAAIIPVAPDHRRLDQPGAHHRPDARPADPRADSVSWEQWPVYVVAELLAGAAAALAFGVIAHTAQDGATDDAEATAPAAAVPAEV